MHTGMSTKNTTDSPIVPHTWTAKEGTWGGCQGGASSLKRASATSWRTSGGAGRVRARYSASRQSPALKAMPSSHSRASPAPAYTTVHLEAQPIPQNRPLKNRGRI